MSRLLTFIWSLWIASALAQEKTPLPQAQLVVSRDTILIGEPVIISYQLTGSEGSKALFLGELNLPSIEILRTADSSWRSSDQSFVQARIWSITSFDTGKLILPAQSWQLDGKNYQTDSDTLYVQYSLKQTPLQYHDLKDILEVPPGGARWKWLVLGVLSVLFAWIAYRFFKSKKKVPIQVHEPASAALTPLETAQQSIQHLLNAQPGISADQWYLTLTQIWHRYLASSCTYPPGELTSFHIEEILRQKLIPATERAVVTDLFEKASLSKFAQQPASEEELRTDTQLLAQWLHAQDPLFNPPKSVL